MKRVVFDPNSPAPSGPYSSAIVASGPLVFLAGQIGRDPNTGRVLEGIEAQTRQAFANMTSLLRAAGSDLKDVVRVLVFLADQADAPRFNQVYGEYFKEEVPVRTRVQAGGLAPGLLLEMEAIAVVPTGRPDEPAQ